MVPQEFDVSSWLEASSAGVSDAIGRVGAMDGGIRRLSGERLVGPAHTVMTGAGDSSSVHRALVEAEPGSVLVIDAQGGQSRAVWGAVLTMAAIERAVVGVVVDGAVRDIEEIQSIGFAVYGRATCPAGPHKGFRGMHGVPIQCGGVVVNPGDIVVGDGDGVAVVPALLTGTVLKAVEKIRTEEQAWISRIKAGETTPEILGLA